jgi:hypothetical protein
LCRARRIKIMKQSKYKNIRAWMIWNYFDVKK